MRGGAAAGGIGKRGYQWGEERQGELGRERLSKIVENSQTFSKTPKNSHKVSKTLKNSLY